MILKRKKNASSVSDEAVERKLNLNIKMQRLIANGDSWTYGSELYDPELVKQIDSGDNNYGKKLNDLNLDPRNSPYRLTRCYPWLLGQHYQSEVVNLAHYADNNNFIAERTIDYVLEQDLWGPDNFVVIGWTAPERNDYYMNRPDSNEFRRRILPDSLATELYPPAIDFLNTYFLHMTMPEEYWARYVKNIVMVESFLKSRDIPYLMFNAFYAGEELHTFVDWETKMDVYMPAIVDSCRMLGKHWALGLELQHTDHSFIKRMWDSVDSRRWYNKNRYNNSFRWEVATRLDNGFMPGKHPNEQGHSAWAAVLINYIEEHGLLRPPSQK